MNLECLMKKSKLVCVGEPLAQNDFKGRIWEEDPDVTEGKHHTDMIVKPVRKFKSTKAINAWVIQIIHLFKFELFVSALFLIV